MKASFAGRLILLSLALIAVLWVIRSLNDQNVQKAFDVLGLQAGGAGSPGLQMAGRPLNPGEERFNICPTRIVGFEFVNGRRIEEGKDGLKVRWLAIEEKPREIGTIDIEKWLSQHCQVAIRKVDPRAVAGISAETPLLIRYVDGSVLKITRVGGEAFKMADGSVFLSRDLADSLAELHRLAMFEPASGL